MTAAKNTGRFRDRVRRWIAAAGAGTLLTGLLVTGLAPTAGAQTTAHASKTGPSAVTTAARHSAVASPAPPKPEVLGNIQTPPCAKQRPQYRRTQPNGHHARVSLGCIKITKNAVAAAPPIKAQPARPGVNAPAAGFSPPSVCPETPAEGVTADRFDLCAYFPASMVISVTDLSNNSTHAITVDFTLESWAELANNSQTWTFSNILTPTTVLGIQPEDGDLIGQVGAYCSDPACQITSSSPADGTIDPVAPPAPQYMQYSFAESTASQVNLHVALELGFNITGAECVANCSPVKISLDDNGNNADPIRCDNQINQSGFRNGGCVVWPFAPIWQVSDAIYPNMGIIVKHDAIATGNYPGYVPQPTWPKELTYLGPNNPQSDRNQADACANQQPSAADVALGNTSCDEYPFASTAEGGAGSSVCFVPLNTQKSQGGSYNNFLYSNRVLEDDKFKVNATYSGNAPGCGTGYAGGSGAASPDNSLDSMLDTYGDNAGCADWSGGDATNSVILPDGERAWFFSDTFLNSPDARKSLWYSSSLHNSIVMQAAEGGISGTITGGNTCQEHNTSLSFWDRYATTSAVPSDASSGGFYWTGDQMVVGSNVVKFYYHGDPVTTSSGGSSFTIDHPAVASIPVSSLEGGGGSALTISPAEFSCGPSNVIWGTSLLSWNGAVYVYGWLSTGQFSGGLYLAKTTAAGLTSPSSWQVYDGMSGSNPVWGSCSSSAAALPISNGDTGFSVDSVNGSLWLVQFDYDNGQVNSAGAISAHPSATPWGFGDTSVPLYQPPTGFVANPYYYQDYEARIQPGLGDSSEVVISYNVNTSAVDTGCVSANAHDASIYRPRFIDVPTSLFTTSSASAAPAAVHSRAGVPTSALARTGTPAATPAQIGAPAVPDKPLPAYGIRDVRPAVVSGAQPIAATSAAKPLASPADSTGGDIDGDTDWYDKTLGGSCPQIPAPSQPTLAPDTDNDNGWVNASWSNVGTDVWYWSYVCDNSETFCASPATSTQGWVQAWAYDGSNLWATQPRGQFDPIDSFGLNTDGDDFGIAVKSFGAGNANGGAYSPVAYIQIIR